MTSESTRWSLIEAAQAGDAAAEEALVVRYRAPVAAYLERRGFGREAEDLAQEVFVRLLRGGVLAKADRSVGRFRNLVLAVTKHVIGNHVERELARKRGGGEVERLGDQDMDIASPERDDDFDREWLGGVLARALERLSREHPRHFEALRGFLIEGRPRGEVAAALGRSTSDMKNDVYRARQKLIAFLREEVWSYASSGEEYSEELRLLSRFLPD